MHKLILGLCSICFLSLQLKGQVECNLRLYGTITDEHDGSRLAYANLVIIDSESNRSGTSANEQGVYEKDGLCPGNYTLIISHIGCIPDTVEVFLNKSKKLDLNLEHHWEELIEVEISDQKTLSNERILSEEDVSKNSGESMAEMIKAIPGVNSLKTGTNVSKPMIGGFTSNRVQILNSGVQHINQNWGDEHAPEIDPFAYVDYKVIKGAGALRYGGGAIGGIVLLDPKPLRRTSGIGGKVYGVYATNNRMYAPSVMLEGNHNFLPKFSWRVQASHKRSGNIRSPDYYQDNTGLSESNFSYQLGWFEEKWNVQLNYSLFESEVGIFSGAHLGNLTDLNNILEQDRPNEIDTEGFSYSIERPYQLITHELVKGSFNRYFENSKIELKLGRQFNIREEFDKELPRNDYLASLNIPEFSLSLESYIANLSYQLNKGNYSLDLGGGVIGKDNTVNSFIDFIPAYNSTQFDLYSVGKWDNKNWNVELAMRMDQMEMDVNQFIQNEYVASQNSFTTYSSVASIGKKLGKLELNLNYNYAERAPAINELYSDGLHHGTASLEYGDPAIKKERAHTIRLNADLEMNRFSIQLNSYLQWIDDFIYLEPDGLDLSTRGAFPVFRWKNTDAFLRGIDLSWSYNILEELKLSQKSSLLWADQGDEYLVNMPSNRIEHMIDYEWQRLQLNFYVSHLYVAKQNKYDKEVEILTPPDAYGLLAGGISKKIEINEKLNARFGLKVNNILNTTYRDYLNRFRFYSDEMGRDIRFSLEINF